MKCQNCGRNEATYYYKSSINGRVTETHLCADCARKLGYVQRMQPDSFFGDDFPSGSSSRCWAGLAIAC